VSVRPSRRRRRGSRSLAPAPGDGAAITSLDAERLADWLAIGADELEERSDLPLTVVATKEALYEHFARSLFDEIAAAHNEQRRLNLIVPMGPKAQYPLLAAMINRAGLRLDHVTFFGMDEWLDWEGRPLEPDHPCNLEAYFHRAFVDLVDDALRPARDDVIFPSPRDLDRSAREIERRGGVDTTYGGIGFQGHLAFNEPPGSRWSPVTLEQLRASRTRLVPAAVDTIIAHAQRSFGGNVFAIPPMAITLGMSELLSAKRVRLYSEGGAWKQTILRILLFMEPTVAYPVTLVHEHPDVRVVVDAETAAAPPTAW
jgi:glucosamine-6-phosphate deaminase